jgi:L-asparaginase/Glu-tRNA(Gln) amidotransferase subunit D
MHTKPATRSTDTDTFFTAQGPNTPPLESDIDRQPSLTNTVQSQPDSVQLSSAKKTQNISCIKSDENKMETVPKYSITD